MKTWESKFIQVYLKITKNSIAQNNIFKETRS